MKGGDYDAVLPCFFHGEPNSQVEAIMLKQPIELAIGQTSAPVLELTNQKIERRVPSKLNHTGV